MRGSQWVAMFGMVDVAVDKIDTIRAIRTVAVNDAGAIISSTDIVGTVGSDGAFAVADLVNSVDTIEAVGTVGAVSPMGTGDGFESVKAVCTVDLVNKVCLHGDESIIVQFSEGSSGWKGRLFTQKMTCKNADSQLLEKEKLEDKRDTYSHGKVKYHGAKRQLDSISSR